MADGSLGGAVWRAEVSPARQEPARWIVVATVERHGRETRREQVPGFEAVGDWDAATLIGWARIRLFTLLARRGWSSEEIAAARLSAERLS